MHKKSLDISVRVHGAEHESVADCYTCMSSVHNLQGTYEEALDLVRKSLEILIKVHGPDHASVADAYSDMATVLMSLGKYEEALALLQQEELLKKLEAMKRRSWLPSGLVSAGFLKNV